MNDEIPNSWINVELHKLLNFVIGGDWGKDIGKSVDGEFVHVKCIRGSEIRNWSKDKGVTASLRKIKAASLTKRKLREGDILLEISGGGPEQPVGRTVIIDKEALAHDLETPKVCTNFLRMLRPSSQIESYYLNYYLTKFYLSGEVVNYQGGSNNLRNLKYKKFEQIPIPLPPLAEQKRIVAKLDALMGHIERSKARLAKVSDLLKAFRQSVLAQAVSGKLTEDWREGREFSKEVKTIKEISSLVTKGASPKWQGINYVDDYNSKSILFITSENVLNFKILESKFKYLEKGFNEKQKKSILKKGDVLTNIVGGSIGRTTMWDLDYNANINQAVCLIRPLTESILSEYLELFLNSPLGLKSIFNDIVDVARANVSLTSIKNIQLSVPPLQEQQEIVRRVEALFAKADAIEAQYEAALQSLETLPQAVLAKAFRGELVEQDAGDEPASVLLERIKAEQAEVKATKKNKGTTKKKKAKKKMNKPLPEYIRETFGALSFTFEELEKSLGNYDYDDLKRKLFVLLEDSEEAEDGLIMVFKKDEEQMYFQLRNPQE